MIVKKWQRVQELFEQASARPREEQSSFLTDACGDDEELRNEVESLLACDHQAPPDFMQPPDPKSEQLSDSGDPDPRIGVSIGGYSIQGVVASGGMGIVYEALQAEPHRTVALKVLHRHVASKSALRRFRFESQILAHLRHPNIAQVFVAGMHDEGSVQVPYFAMEYVPDARTIIEYAAEKKLSIRERLELFTQVCEAVHHGHQKGIIHRDLKPGNILVDSSGRPKIIDFGVARSTDSDIAMTTMQTDVGQMIGTLQYMSPEQCDADPHEIDTRSDVYSLGVVLYELLTGRLPYDVSHMTIHSGTRLICEELPAKPSEFDRRLRGDVETIVLKALEKDRENRYQSMAGMAEDIHRYLNGEPIAARSPTALTQCVRWVTRHPFITTATACVGLAAIIVSATWIAVWFMNLRPHEIVRYKAGQPVGRDYPRPTDEARLLSYSGRSLREWGGGAKSIRFAKLVGRPVELGGGRLALLGFSFDPLRRNRFSGSLCAFDADGDLEEPVWQRHVEPGTPLPDPFGRGHVAEEFGVGRCWLFDVFPNQPGLEIVVIHPHAVRSQSFIRIYDLRGKLLYQVWHDGTAQSCYWMSDAELLVFAGSDATVNWGSGGKPLTTGADPLVVFAVRPSLGHIVQDYAHRFRGNDDTSLAWCKYLHLRDRSVDIEDGYGLLLGPVYGTPDIGRHVRVNLLFTSEDPGATVSWDLDEFGVEAPEPRVVGDAYQRNQLLPDDDPEKLPDPDGFHLGERSPRADDTER